MANGYSMSMSGTVITTPTVIPQNVTNAIRVNENTPNLQMIQSFPVVSRDGNVHIHQDPTTGQMYEMTDEFHAMIPQILNNITDNAISSQLTSQKKSEFKLIADSIENFSSEIVTESTPNLSEILAYQLYGTEFGFSFYKDPVLFKIYIVSDNIKNNSELILSTRDKNISSVSMYLKADLNEEMDNIPVIIDSIDVQKPSPIVRESQVFIMNNTKTRYTYPSISYSSTYQNNDTRNTRSTTLSIDHRHAYPSIR